jgi:predicted ester cyclase
MDNKTLVTRLFEEGWNRGSTKVCDEIVADEFRNHDPQNPQVPNGPAGAKQLITTYRTAFPDLRLTIDHQMVDGDYVCTRWTAVGTHKGNLMGMNPTGNRATVIGCSIDRCKNGKIVETWSTWDTLGLWQQLGFAPRTPSLEPAHRPQARP